MVFSFWFLVFAFFYDNVSAIRCKQKRQNSLSDYNYCKSIAQRQIVVGFSHLSQPLIQFAHKVLVNIVVQTYWRHSTYLRPLIVRARILIKLDMLENTIKTRSQSLVILKSTNQQFFSILVCLPTFVHTLICT